MIAWSNRAPPEPPFVDEDRLGAKTWVWGAEEWAYIHTSTCTFYKEEKSCPRPMYHFLCTVEIFAGGKTCFFPRASS